MWGRTSRTPPPLLPTSRRSSSLRSSTSTSSWKQRSFLKGFSHNNVFFNLLTAVLSEGGGSVALKSNSLEAQQGPKLHLDLYIYLALYIFLALYVIIQVFLLPLNYYRHNAWPRCDHWANILLTQLRPFWICSDFQWKGGRLKLKRLQGELWTGDLQRLAIGQQRRCQYCIIVTERRKGKFFEAGKFRSGSLFALQFKEEEGRKRSSETRSGGEQCCWAETFSSTDPLFAIIRQFPIQGFKVFQIDGNTKVKLILNFVLAFNNWFCFPCWLFFLSNILP